MPEITTQLPGLVSVTLRPLVDRDASAQHRSNLDKIDICREMADVSRIGDDVVRESAID